MTNEATNVPPDEAAIDAPRPIVYGVASALSPMVRRIVAANPSMMTGPGTNTYLVGIDEIVVIDPGPGDAEHLDAIAGCGGDRIRWILLTHTHEDHTPGHASDHLCFLLNEGRTLFTGDHIMQGSTVVIRPPDGDMGAYLRSLERIKQIRPRLRAIAPGHGHLITNPLAAIDEYIEHRLAREQQVLSAVEERGSATVTELVDQIYVDLAPELHPMARYSVWAHLRKLADDGVVKGDDLDGTWSTA